jgi:hypothetical protein
MNMGFSRSLGARRVPVLGFDQVTSEKPGPMWRLSRVLSRPRTVVVVGGSNVRCKSGLGTAS